MALLSRGDAIGATAPLSMSPQFTLFTACGCDLKSDLRHLVAARRGAAQLPGVQAW
jgi:hypothetical protein